LIDDDCDEKEMLMRLEEEKRSLAFLEDGISE